MTRKKWETWQKRKENRIDKTGETRKIENKKVNKKEINEKKG